MLGGADRDAVFISIHALHEESDGTPAADRCSWIISIHALHEESDQTIVTPSANTFAFQSTLSMRRATTCQHRDSPCKSTFQSTLSMRRATALAKTGIADNPFQSTLSMRRATRLLTRLEIA